jgi:hypothetical protein
VQEIWPIKYAIRKEPGSGHYVGLPYNEIGNSAWHDEELQLKSQLSFHKGLAENNDDPLGSTVMVTKIVRSRRLTRRAF